MWLFFRLCNFHRCTSHLLTSGMPCWLFCLLPSGLAGQTGSGAAGGVGMRLVSTRLGEMWLPVTPQWPANISNISSGVLPGITWFCSGVVCEAQTFTVRTSALQLPVIAEVERAAYHTDWRNVKPTLSRAITEEEDLHLCRQEGLKPSCSYCSGILH